MRRSLRLGADPPPNGGLAMDQEKSSDEALDDASPTCDGAGKTEMSEGAARQSPLRPLKIRGTGGSGMKARQSPPCILTARGTGGVSEKRRDSRLPTL